jgi:subtilisin family serine protease
MFFALRCVGLIIIGAILAMGCHTPMPQIPPKQSGNALAILLQGSILVREWKEISDGQTNTVALYRTPAYPRLVRTESLGTNPPSVMMGDQIVLSFRNQPKASEIARLLAPSGLFVRHYYPISRLWLIGFAAPDKRTVNTTRKQVKELLAGFSILDASPDLLAWLPEITVNDAQGKPLLVGGPDVLSSNQWALNKVLAFDAWKQVGNSTKSPLVAIIDTGVASTHEDLIDARWWNEKECNGQPGVDDDQNGYIDDFSGWNFLDCSGSPEDDSPFSHGTRCAGLIAAVHNNGKGIKGLCPNARYVPLKCFGETGMGSASAATEAIAFARKLGCDVINCSWILPVNDRSEIEFLRKEIEENLLNHSEAVLVAACGDRSQDLDRALMYPACAISKKKITVLATDECDAPNPESNSGSAIQLGAPGVYVFMTHRPESGNTEPYSHSTGSSFAAAHVSGAAAFLKTCLADPTSESVIKAMTDSADEVEDNSTLVWPKKRLNLKRALNGFR